MRNLQVYEINRLQLPVKTYNLKSAISANNCLYYVSNRTLYYFMEKEGTSHPLLEEMKCITDLVYIQALQHIWYGSGTSFIFLNPTTRDTRTIETQYSYVCAAWSPNQELLAVCDDKGIIRCYKDVFYNLTPDNNFLNVNNVPLTRNIARFDAKIFWSENSQYFCVCYFDCRYMLRIYAIGGKIENKRLVIPYMLPNITWRRGMIVCAVKDLGNKQLSISMHGRNGQLRTKFYVEETVKEIHNLKWNDSENILAVHVTTDEGTFLNLYTEVNYKFYLKQQLVYSEDNPLTTFNFARSKYIAHLTVTTARNIIFYKFIFKFQHGQLQDDHAFCAEVDGPLLKFTKITRDKLTDTHQISPLIVCRNPINAVVLDHTFKRCVVVDSFGNLSLHEFDGTNFVKIIEKSSYVNENLKFKSSNYYNMCFVKETKVYSTTVNNVNTHDFYELDLNTMDMIPIKLDNNNSHLVFVHEFGKLIKLTKDRRLFYDDVLKLKELTYEVHKVDYTIIEGKVHILILDVMDRFYIDDCVVFSGVTSFITHAGYLYLTTISKKLYCVELTSETIENTVNEELFKAGMYCMTCEDGILLLCGVPEQKHILMYRTRGNTEYLLCKNVALEQVQYFIDTKQWSNAYNYAQMANLDLNVLADIKPAAFLDQIKDFIAAVQEPDLLEKFILNLREENMLTTIYEDVIYLSVTILQNKKQHICKAILDAVKDKLKDYIKVAISASYVDGGVEKSVDILYDLYKCLDEMEDVLIDGIKCLNLYEATSNIRTACAKKLDIEFVKYIFEKLQVERGVYNSLFKEVDQHFCDVNRQFFIIHNGLQNYKEAVSYLLKSCLYLKEHVGMYMDFEDMKEIIEYATRYDILSELYKYARDLDFHDARIIKAYAGKLMQCNRYEEAGLIFAINCMWNEALNAYVKGQKWKESIFVLKTSGERRKAFLHTLAKSMYAFEDYDGAAKIYERHLGEIRLSVKCLADGQFYTDAIDCSHKCEKDDIIEDIIRPKYKDNFEALMEKIQTLIDTFMKYVERLQAVRDVDLAAVVDLASISAEEGIEVIECTSLSQQSLSPSRSTSETSSYQKPDNKKYDLREGSVFENITLMKTLHDTICEAYELSTNIKRVNYVYILLEPYGLQSAKALQVAYEKLLQVINQNIPFIWPLDLNSVNIQPTLQLKAFRKNLDELDMKYRHPPEMVPTNWTYNIVEELID